MTTGPDRVTMSGGMALAKMFAAHDVGPMFGMAGFQLLPFYDGVRSLGLTHYLTSDERSAAFAVDAYARVTGRPGVCDATLGPGATNLATGLAESYNAGVPVIAITGNANRAHAGKNMTQEGRQAEMLRPAVKELIRVELPERIPELVRRAYAVATSGRPGPVILDVPEDVCHAEVEFAESDFHADPATTRIPARRARLEAAAVAEAAALLSAARRPVVLAGGGVHLSGAYDALQALAEQQHLPVAHTMSGKGAIACTHPLSAGLFGRYSRIANDLIAESDCLLVVGCKLGEIATSRYELIKPGTPVIHLDSTAEEFGRTTPATVALWGDAREGLRDLAAALADSDPGALAARRASAEQVATRMAAWRESVRARLESAEQPINVARLVAELNAVLPDDAVLVADGGFAAHWTGLLYDTKRAGRGYVADRGFASIGYGAPGALGAWLGAPDRAVVALTGDGGLNMSLGELETAVRIGASFVLVVVNNAASGYVKALQHLMFEGRYQSADLHEIDYARLGEAMGARGIRVTDPAQLAAAIKEGLAETGRPTVLDVVVTRDAGLMLPGVDSRAAKIRKGDRIA